MNDATPQHPPVAPRKPASVTHHGITVTDDYAWLRDPGYPDVDDADVIAHLNAENAWFEARMAAQEPVIDTLFAEMRARIKEADSSVPQKDGDWLYWTEFEEGAEYRKWYRRPVAGGDAQLILDEPALAQGKEYFRLGAMSVSNLFWAVGSLQGDAGQGQRLRAASRPFGVVMLIALPLVAWLEYFA